MRFRRLALTLATLGAFTPSISPANAAGSQTVTTEYGMALIGLIIGKATFDTVIDDRRFSVKGRMSSAGLGSLVSKTGGTSSVSGQLSSRGLSAERYGLDYTSDGKRWKSDVRLRSGRVTTSSVSPKRSRDEKPSYIPVRPSQLTSVVDPLSGLMIRTKDAASVCRRTLPLYDGWSRLDLRLSSGGTQPLSITGYSGNAVVCKVRVAPVSGYDKKSKGLQFLQEQTIELWFAPIAQPDLYVPVYARIPTTIGPLTLQARSVSIK